jgi:hypothetical protein
MPNPSNPAPTELLRPAFAGVCVTNNVVPTNTQQNKNFNGVLVTSDPTFAVC